MRRQSALTALALTALIAPTAYAAEMSAAELAKLAQNPVGNVIIKIDGWVLANDTSPSSEASAVWISVGRSWRSTWR